MPSADSSNRPCLGLKHSETEVSCFHCSPSCHQFTEGVSDLLVHLPSQKISSAIPLSEVSSCQVKPYQPLHIDTEPSSVWRRQEKGNEKLVPPKSSHLHHLRSSFPCSAAGIAKFSQCKVQRPMHQRAPVGHWRQHLCYKIGSALSQKPVSRAALHFRDETHRLLRLRCSVCLPHLLNGGCSVRRFPGQPVHRPLGSEGQGDSAGREGDRWWSCTRRCWCCGSSRQRKRFGVGHRCQHWPRMKKEKRAQY